MSSPDDHSKFVVKTNVSADTFQNAASSIAEGGNGDGAVFNPMEAMAAGIRSGNTIVQMLKICALLFARGIIAPVELILRRQFGERYFNGLVTMMVAIILLVSYSFMRIHGFYCILIGVVYVGLTSFNLRQCFKRDRAGDYWHSYSEGESRIRRKNWDEKAAAKNFTFDISKLFIEPVVVLAAGLACLILPSQRIAGAFYMNPLALYLMVTGVTLFFYQFYCYQYRHNLLLDEKDGEVIAEIRAKIASHNEKEGIFIHKGVSYSILGGKKEWNPPPVP